MANETEQLLQEMREILASMKDVSKFTKDLTQAVGSMARPMQQASDYMKAIAEQSDAAAKVNSGILDDQRKFVEAMQSSVELLKERNKLTEEEKHKRAELLEAQKKKVELEIEERAVTKQRKLEWEEFGKQRQTEQELENRIWETQISLIERAKRSVEHYQESIAKAGWEMKKLEDGTVELTKKAGVGAFIARQAPAATHLMTGTANAGAAVSNMIGSISSTFLPAMGIGGLIGMMIHGVHRDEEFRAVGERASQMFDAIGGPITGMNARFSRLARDFETFGRGTREDVIAVAQAFSSVGISAEEASKKVEGFNSIIGSDLIALTLSADKALEMAAGTTAKFAGILKSDFNESAESGVIKLLNLGSAAQKAGLNTVTFMQQVMDAASAVRTLNVNFEDLGKFQLRMVDVMKNRGFNEQFANQRAAAGSAGLANAMANMDGGIAAVLGERMFGQGINGLDAIYRFQSPMARGDLNMVDFVKAIRSVLAEVGQTDAEKFTFLTKGPMQLTPAAADMVMAAIGELGRSGGLSDTTKRGLSRGIENEADKRNRMDQNIEIIKDAVSSVMVGMLGMVINGLKAIYNATMWFGAKVTSALSPGSHPDLDAIIKEATSNMSTNVADMGKGGGRIINALKQIRGAVDSDLDLMGLNTKNMVSFAATTKAIDAVSAPAMLPPSMKRQKEMEEYNANNRKRAWEAVKAGDAVGNIVDKFLGTDPEGEAEIQIRIKNQRNYEKEYRDRNQ